MLVTYVTAESGPELICWLNRFHIFAIRTSRLAVEAGCDGGCWNGSKNFRNGDTP